MKNKIFGLIILSFFMFITPVFAENNVDYTLTITDDYKFNEVIKYEISDYKQIVNGYNPFADIVEEDKITVDIMDKSTYKKTKKFSGGKYYVTLKYTHSEYTLSNSIFLNDCFENSSYDYDIDKYSFKGNGGFYCLKGDNLKITIVTNLEVTDTNATVSGNKYTWNPTGNDFTMNMEINKTYKETETNISGGHGIDESSNNEPKEELPEGVDNYDTDDPSLLDSDNQEESEKGNIFGTIIGIIILLTAVTGIIIAIIVLKNKHSDLDKI